MSDESGFTLVELLVGIFAFVVLLSAIMMMTTVATHNQERISDRVAANQRARPVMTRLIDALHSACVAPRVAPVLTGSTSTSISFISKSGSSVSPTPDQRVVTLSGGNLTEQVYPATGGAPPTWTFSGTPSSTQTLLTNVSAPGGVVFRYYDYVNGQLNTVPLPTSPGLSATNAARTAYVSVSFTAAPSGGASSLDSKSPITLSDSADLRLESANQVTTQDNLPCM
jgi:hypothetical protein